MLAMIRALNAAMCDPRDLVFIGTGRRNWLAGMILWSRNPKASSMLVP